MKYLRFVALALLFVFLGLLLVHSLGSINQDIGRHLKLGQIIWETKSVPQTNLFSFTEPDYPFINHHWLSEVVFYLLSGIIGLKGLIIFKAAVILAAFGIISATLYKKTGLWPLVTSFTLGVLIFDRTDVRPEIFSYLFLAIFLAAIFKAKYFGAYKWLWVLPLIQLLWTNMHIYFVLGPGLLFLFLIDRLVHKENAAAPKNLALIFLITCAVTLINPNFIKGALQPFMILNDYGYSIAENQSIFFLKDYGAMLTPIWLFELSLITLILGFVIAIRNGARKITFELLAALVFAALGMRMVRNFGIYALAFIPIFALNISTIRLPVWLTRKKATIAVLIIALLSLVWLVLAVADNKYFERLESGKKFGLEIPAGAARGVEFVRQNNIKGPVFNNFDVGSFLIWKLYPVPSRQSGSYGTSPEFRVFVDGRPEAYSVDFFENIYKPMQEDPKMWKYYSEKYGINYIFFAHTDITPWAREFLYNISLNTGWPLVYKDGSVAVFLKRIPANSVLIRKFEIKSR